MSKPNKNEKLTQHQTMRNQMIGLVAFSLIPLGAFAVVFVTHGIAVSQSMLNLAREGLFFTIAAFCVWGSVLIIGRYLHRAYVFYLLKAVCIFSFSSVALIIFLRLTSRILGAYRWIFLLLLAFVIVLGYYHSFTNKLSQSNKWEGTGLFSAGENESDWELDVKLLVQQNKLETAKNKSRQDRRVRSGITGFFITALILSLLLGKDAGTSVMMVLLLIALLYVTFQEIGKQLAMLVIILRYENTSGRRVLVLDRE